MIEVGPNHWQQGIYTVCTGTQALDFDAVYEFLTKAPWATGLSQEAMRHALHNSLCFSLFREGSQVGFARLITDHVTYAYLCDVYVVEDWRGQGLGSWLIRCVLDHPDIRLIRRVSLITHDAQNFYLDLGFEFPPHQDRYLERLQISANP